MSLGNKVPVYLVNGFLESGKTTFIQETLSDPYFSDGGRLFCWPVRKEKRNMICMCWNLMTQNWCR